MTVAAVDQEFQNRMRELEGLLQEAETIADPAARAKTHQIVQGVVEFFGAGMNAIVEHLDKSGEAGRALIGELSQDELVASLLLLYGLHPQDMGARVRSALEKVRPYLASHGGSVELLGITDEGVVRLRMQGSCHGCPSSAATLKTTIEAAIYEKAPDVTAIDVEGVEPEPASKPAAGFVPIEQLTRSGAKHRLPQGASL